MKFPKLKKDDPVDFTWYDIYDPAVGAWADDEDIKKAIKIGATVANSRCFFYCEEGAYLYFYTDKIDEKYSRISGIPKGCIVSIKKAKK